MTNPSVTFVSAFLDLREDRSNDKSYDRCFSLFDTLANSGLSICIFVSSSFIDRAKEICRDKPNIYLAAPIELEELWTYNTTKLVDVKLPQNRNEYHDTYNFLVLMNSKIEFVSKAMEIDPFKTQHFAWIDFSICHVIHLQDTLKRLYTFSHSQLKDRMLVFPGCWARNILDIYYDKICDQVLWRYCGGFFIGDIHSLNSFYSAYRLYYKSFLEERRTLVWEVNFWAWLEYNGHLCPDVFMGDHNDSIVRIPGRYLKIVASMTTIPSRIERCKLAIKSLLSQVDHIYISVSSYYERFGNTDIAIFINELASNERITIVDSQDYGPATKYLGALSKIPDATWIFFCDDDQEYHPNLIENMTNNISCISCYQNRYDIVKTGSGGIIHGYVGNMFHKSLLNKLQSFDLPKCACYVDDQWMSIYCFINNITILPTPSNNYSDIFSVLSNGYEQIGEDSLASIGNRDTKVKELANYFNIVFLPDGIIEHIKSLEP